MKKRDRCYPTKSIEEYQSFFFYYFIYKYFMRIVENRNYRELYKQETKIIHNSLTGLTAATPLLSLLPESFTRSFIHSPLYCSIQTYTN